MRGYKSVCVLEQNLVQLSFAINLNYTLVQEWMMSQTAKHVYRDITAMFLAQIVPQESVKQVTSVQEDPTLQGISYS